jgi:transcriptional regulator with XRE-family HTH domain
VQRLRFSSASGPLPLILHVGRTRLPHSMDAQQIAAARETVGWSYEKLAEALDVSVGKLRAWESGQRRIPRRHARTLEAYVAVAEHDAALRRAGFPQCEWSAGWDITPFPDDDDEMLESLRELEDHERTCPSCIARERYAREHLPPLPSFPTSRRWALLSAAVDTVDQLPRWPRAFVLGALMAASFIVFAAIFEIAKSPAELQRAVLFYGSIIVLGGFGGMFYSAMRRFRRTNSPA